MSARVCYTCGIHADHVELSGVNTLRNGARGRCAWTFCEAHVPWSGHFERCGEMCRRLQAQKLGTICVGPLPKQATRCA